MAIAKLYDLKFGRMSVCFTEKELVKARALLDEGFHVELAAARAKPALERVVRCVAAALVVARQDVALGVIRERLPDRKQDQDTAQRLLQVQAEMLRRVPPTTAAAIKRHVAAALMLYARARCGWFASPWTASIDIAVAVAPLLDEEGRPFIITAGVGASGGRPAKRWKDQCRLELHRRGVPVMTARAIADAVERVASENLKII